MRCTACLFWVVSMSLFSTSAASEPVPTKADEVVHLFPAYATLKSSGDWHTAVRGWVFEPEEDSIMRALTVEAFGKSLGLHSEHPSWALFDTRLRWFLVDNERGKRVGVKWGDVTGVGRSTPDGHFTATLHVPSKTPLSAQGAPTRQPLQGTPSVDGRVAEGEVFMVPPEGLSIISDIDDTVKVTNVLDRKEMIHNTFTRPFTAVPGMATLYQEWAQRGAMLHFLSSSPWQLQPLLATFLEESGFPRATFHLKSVRLKDRRLFNLFKSSTETKPPQIEAILKDFPKRRFILVGDSGEHDPEVYGQIARAYRQQIEHIYIRRVPNDPKPASRFDAAFAELPASLWTVFEDPEGVRQGLLKAATERP